MSIRIIWQSRYLYCVSFVHGVFCDYLENLATPEQILDQFDAAFAPE